MSVFTVLISDINYFTYIFQTRTKRLTLSTRLSEMMSVQKESTAVSLCDTELICRDSGGHSRPTGNWTTYSTVVFAVIWLFHHDRDFYMVPIEMTLHSPLHLHGVAHD
jgi:hypothetical protein